MSSVLQSSQCSLMGAKPGQCESTTLGVCNYPIKGACDESSGKIGKNEFLTRNKKSKLRYWTPVPLLATSSSAMVQSYDTENTRETLCRAPCLEWRDLLGKQLKTSISEIKKDVESLSLKSICGHCYWKPNVMAIITDLAYTRNAWSAVISDVYRAKLIPSGNSPAK